MPPHSLATLRRFDALGWELWLVPTLAAATGAAVLRSAGPDLGLLRGLVFVGGPLLLLAGLHPRLEAYLHSGARQQLLCRPISPSMHWAAARGPHRRGMAVTGVLGLVILTAVGLSAGPSGSAVAGLVGDWACLWAVAALLEPSIPAVSAWLGRRFPEPRPEHQLQRKLGGGWTIPEAVVHLYAPALGVGLAALLAMPAQLWIDRRVDDLASPAALGVTALGAIVLAATIGRVAPRIYDRGLFGAVPWVHEAIRTLAGPPVPETVPAWLLVGRDPVRHLVLRQFWRTTPVPGLRLFALLGGTAWIALAAPPSVAAAAILVALAAAWLVPAARLHALGDSRARLCAPLPLAGHARAGRSFGAWAILCAPVLVAMMVTGLAWSRAA